MKKLLILFTSSLALATSTLLAQTNTKEYKVGHVFTINLPDYMTKTGGLNSAAAIQFINVEKDVAGIVIEDTKESLQLAEVANLSDINKFYDAFISDFLKGEEKRTVSAPVNKKIGTTNFTECDVSYYDKDSKIEIYYFVGIAETPTSFYKVLCWGKLENKGTYKADFQKILYSLKD